MWSTVDRNIRVVLATDLEGDELPDNREPKDNKQER